MFRGPRPITPEDLKNLDFSRHSLSIGVALENQPTPWLTLSSEDLQILYGHLMTVLPGTTSSAAEASVPLRLLADWCLAALDWLEDEEGA